MDNKGYTLITGASGGLGRELAILCAERGDNLILSGTNKERLEQSAAAAREKRGDADIIVKTCDLSSEEDRRAFFKFVKDSGFQIDFLVNNAGLILEGDLLTQSHENMKKIIRINCEGTVDLTRFVLDNRDREKTLRILTISSLSSEYPMPHMSLYGATKSFLTNFFTAIAYELKNESVIVTTILPSGIPTTKAMKEAIVAQGFGGRVTAMSAEGVARFALGSSKKGKVVAVPKSINRFLLGLSRPLGIKAKAKIIERRWRKAQEVRNIKEDK